VDRVSATRWKKDITRRLHRLLLAIMRYGLYSYLVSLGFIYPRLDWDDPRRIRRVEAAWPGIGLE
jgi:hypothetical protein